jgi:hypothetical protein
MKKEKEKPPVLEQYTYIKGNKGKRSYNSR